MQTDLIEDKTVLYIGAAAAMLFITVFALLAEKLFQRIGTWWRSRHD